MQSQNNKCNGFEDKVSNKYNTATVYQIRGTFLVLLEWISSLSKNLAGKYKVE